MRNGRGIKQDARIILIFLYYYYYYLEEMKITKIIQSETNNHINFTPEAERFFKAYHPPKGLCLSCDEYGILVIPELICFPCWLKQEIDILKHRK